jgi:hypothetical protein
MSLLTHVDSCPSVITCPVCGSDGPALRHDIRSSLLYICEQCEHEWRIDPAGEPPPAALPQYESPRTVAPSSKCCRKR